MFQEMRFTIQGLRLRIQSKYLGFWACTLGFKGLGARNFIQVNLTWGLGFEV